MVAPLATLPARHAIGKVRSSSHASATFFRHTGEGWNWLEAFLSSRGETGLMQAIPAGAGVRSLVPVRQTVEWVLRQPAEKRGRC